jgi:sugar phosphate isomerase/epimerase
MKRPITLCTGQFADIPLEKLASRAAEWGYDGRELACWADHGDVSRAARDKEYAKSRKKILAKYGLKLYAISNHLAGQLVCDPNDDSRSDIFAPKSCHGNAEAKRKWAIKEMKNSALAAAEVGAVALLIR